MIVRILLRRSLAAGPAETVRVVTGGRGLPGRPGVNGEGHIHQQPSEAAEWVVNHNLGFKPAVTVLSPGGIEVGAHVVHANANQVRIHFASPASGSARCI